LGKVAVFLRSAACYYSLMLAADLREVIEGKLEAQSEASHCLLLLHAWTIRTGVPHSRWRYCHSTLIGYITLGFAQQKMADIISIVKNLFYLKFFYHFH